MGLIPMANLQVIQKQDLDPEGLISLHHVFSTIQGEGPFVGHPAIFVRLAGCNLQCPMCDTDYTSMGIRRTLQHLHRPLQIVHMISELVPAPYLIVISGGEPFRQNIYLLVYQLIESGYQVQIETNGTLFVDLWKDDDFVREDLTIVCSPKTGRLNTDLVSHIDCFKYIVDADNIDPEDGLPTIALGHPAYPRLARPPGGFEGQIYVQPMDTGGEEENNRHIDAAVHSAMKYGYILSLQTHKILGLE